ncbi:SirB2 family protein [Azohydromonas lata]|uniref:SirB2 family protein n=1 Tax=Azohydromonas lata TaxID=45677 RepID=UPI001EE47767|nr:SirB2 family protein [Azohydromonas lata]
MRGRLLIPMALTEHYFALKHAHVGLVYLSGSLFALRGGALAAGARWPMAVPLRIAAVAVDTALVTAALLVLASLAFQPLAAPWLWVKLALLPVYVALGTFALKRARNRTQRVAGWLLALAVFGFMISVARAHHPLGLLHTLAG